MSYKQPIPIIEIIRALEGEAGNTDTDPRWLAASALRQMMHYESLVLLCSVVPRPPARRSGTRGRDERDEFLERPCTDVAVCRSNNSHLLSHLFCALGKNMETSMSDLDSLKSIWQHLERPDGWGRAALEVRWAIIEIERLRADYDLLAARCKEAERLLRGASEVRCDNGNFDKDGFPTTCVDTQWHERANAWLAAAPGDEHE